MKAAKRESRRSAASAAAPPPRRTWLYGVGLLAAIYATFQVYAPVLHGPFLFDDEYLPFRVDNFPDQLWWWVGRVRPLLMITYWANFRLSGTDDTFSYHVINVLCHAVNGFLVYWLARRFLELAQVEARVRNLLAVFAGGLFLLHPAQTESVAYVASRSENFSVMWVLAALTAFLYRRAESISWTRSGAVLALFLAAMASKEHTAVLPVVLLLTDYYWNPGFSLKGIRSNWRLYVPMALGAAAGVASFFHLFLTGSGAGFGLKDFTWYQYFFTQCRALFVYLRLFVLPVNLSADYDFPISRTVFEHGAIVGLVVLLAITAAAWIWRRRFPLASYGWFVFLVFMAPTSSIVPIKDPVAERRLYLSMLGLLLIAFEFLRRVRAGRKTLAAVLGGVLLIFAIGTYQRNGIWSDNIALWQDTVEKSPNKPRPRFQLAYAYYEANRCADALPHYAAVARLQPPAYDLYVDWALAYDCVGQWEAAIAKLHEAAAMERAAPVYVNIATVYARQSRWDNALQALATAEQIEPGYATTFITRGDIYTARRELTQAVEAYRRATALDPSSRLAREKLSSAEAALRAVR